MEPTQKQVKYIICTQVQECFEKVVSRWLDGIGAAARFQNISQGWFVLFEGSKEAIYFGETPPFKVGDKIKITFENINDATTG